MHDFFLATLVYSTVAVLETKFRVRADFGVKFFFFFFLHFNYTWIIVSGNDEDYISHSIGRTSFKFSRLY